MLLVDMDFMGDLRTVTTYIYSKYSVGLKQLGMDMDDVVGEVALKLVKNQIEYDSEKASLKRFLTLIVDRYCQDTVWLLRAKKRPSLLFYEESVSEDSESTFLDLLGGEEMDMTENLVFEDLLNSLPGGSVTSKVSETPIGISVLGVRDVAKLLLHGYKKKEIANMFGVSTTTISSILKNNEEMVIDSLR